MVSTQPPIHKLRAKFGIRFIMRTVALQAVCFSTSIFANLFVMLKGRLYDISLLACF